MSEAGDRHNAILVPRSLSVTAMSVTWYNPTGGEQLPEHWLDGGATTLGIRLSRDDLQGQDGLWWELVVLFNPHDGEVNFTVPTRGDGSDWTAEIDTAQPLNAERRAKGGEAIPMAPLFGSPTLVTQFRTVSTDHLP